MSSDSAELIEALVDGTGEMPSQPDQVGPFGYSEVMLRYCRDRGIVIQALVR